PVRDQPPPPHAWAVAGRADIPANLRRDYEQAAQLLDEASRILDRKAEPVKRAVKASAREELDDALEELRLMLENSPFDGEAFLKSYDHAGVLVDRHLSSWRKSEFREYAESIGVAVLVALLLREFVVEAFKIPSGSMLPTLQLQDHIFVNKFAYGPK